MWLSAGNRSCLHTSLWNSQKLGNPSQFQGIFPEVFGTGANSKLSMFLCPHLAPINKINQMNAKLIESPRNSLSLVSLHVPGGWSLVSSCWFRSESMLPSLGGSIYPPSSLPSCGPSICCSSASFGRLRFLKAVAAPSVSSGELGSSSAQKDVRFAGLSGSSPFLFFCFSLSSI